MRKIKLFEEFDRDGYQSHWLKFKNWLNTKIELRDNENDLYEKFMEVANNDNLAVEEKCDDITSYLFRSIIHERNLEYEDYYEIWEYLDQLFMDEI